MAEHAQTDELDFERLALIAGGHTAFNLLWAGVELGLYDLLAREPDLALADIAAHLQLEHQPARILLTGLTALKILRKQEDRYTNAALTGQMLVGDRPGSPAPILGWQAHIVYPGLVDFVQSLKENRNVGLRHFPGSGDTLYERLAGNPALEEIFQEAMRALSSQANQHLLRNVDFSRFTHVVDIGGGDGSNAIALARANPALRVTVFESASVCEIAERCVAEAGLTDRISTWPGEMFSSSFPDGADAILFSHIFTIWSLDKDLLLLKKSFDALPDQGSVLIFGMIGDDDDAGPISTALGSPYFLSIATGEGMLYTWSDYEKLMLKAGFSSVARIDQLPLDHGVIIGTK